MKCWKPWLRRRCGRIAAGRTRSLRAPGNPQHRDYRDRPVTVADNGAPPLRLPAGGELCEDGMTTKLPPSGLPDYPTPTQLPDPEPVPDAMFQFFDIVDTATMLRAYLAPRPPLGEDRPATVVVAESPSSITTLTTSTTKCRPTATWPLTWTPMPLSGATVISAGKWASPPISSWKLHRPAPAEWTSPAKGCCTPPSASANTGGTTARAESYTGARWPGERLAAGAYQPLDPATAAGRGNARLQSGIEPRGVRAARPSAAVHRPGNRRVSADAGRGAGRARIGPARIGGGTGRARRC